MSELTTERLEKKIKSCIEIENCEVMMPLSAAQELLESRRILEGLDQPAIDGGWTARGISEYAKGLEAKLLAYEQAAKNPIAWVVGDEEIADFKNGREVCVMRDCDDEQLDYLPLYAAPVLPKQPELLSIGELLHRLEEQTGEKWVEESVQHVIPRQLTQRMAEEKALSLGAVLSDDEADAFADGWNVCRAEMLKAQQNEPQNIPENIPAQHVIPIGLVQAINRLLDNDGSRGCFDALEQHRAKTELELLLAAAQPVSEPYKLPSGYALVPCKLTAENGAKSCMSGEFTEQTEISCPECFGDDECETCDGSGMIEVTVPVSWTTIKDIWVKGIEHFAAAPAQEQK